MNEILFIKRDKNDINQLNVMKIVFDFGVLEIQKTDDYYLIDLTQVNPLKKLKSLLLLDQYINFENSYPLIENLHDSQNLSIEIDFEVTNKRFKEYKNIGELNSIFGVEIKNLTYSHYIHFEKNTLVPKLIETKNLIANLANYIGDDFFFSVPYLKSLIFRNKSDNLNIKFVKIKNEDKNDTIALIIVYSDGTTKYGDVSYNPPKGKIGATVQLTEFKEISAFSKINI